MMTIEPLRGLRNGQNTDLAKGTIRNADAVLLLLHANGGTARTGLLKSALVAWRPGPSYGYLFQYASPHSDAGYGFVGSRFDQAYTKVGHAGSFRGAGDFTARHESLRRNFYYRVRTGVVAISAEGLRRLAELGVC